MAATGRRGRNPLRQEHRNQPSDRIKAFFFIALIITLALTVLFNYISTVQPQNKAALQNSSIALSLMFPLIVINILLSKNVGPKGIISELCLSRDRLTVKNIGIGLVMFLLIMLLEVGLSALSAFTGIQLPTNTCAAFAGAPLYALIFTVFIAPLDEEVLFRGFLVNRFGIVLSALLFMILHSGYASISEAIGALVFGLIAGYAFKRTKSLYPSITCHVLVNMIGVLALLHAVC